MRKIILFVSFLVLVKLNSFSQQATAEDVQVTRNAADVKGLLKICAINESAGTPFGNQAKLREKAIAKAKVTAFAKGANIILIEVDNFEATPYNNVNIVGTAYQSKTLKENETMNTKVNNQSCDDVKRELKLYKEKYGDLRETQSTVTNNLDNGVEFNLISVEGDKLNQIVTVNFYLYTRKPNQRVEVYVKSGGNNDWIVKATDDEGNQYKAKTAALGDVQKEYSVENKLNTEVKLKGSIKFTSVLPSVKQFSLVSIYMESRNYDDYDNKAEGTIDLKNVPIKWK